MGRFWYLLTAIPFFNGFGWIAARIRFKSKWFMAHFAFYVLVPIATFLFLTGFYKNYYLLTFTVIGLYLVGFMHAVVTERRLGGEVLGRAKRSMADDGWQYWIICAAVPYLNWVAWILAARRYGSRRYWTFAALYLVTGFWLVTAYEVLDVLPFSYEADKDLWIMGWISLLVGMGHTLSVPRMPEDKDRLSGAAFVTLKYAGISAAALTGIMVLLNSVDLRQSDSVRGLLARSDLDQVPVSQNAFFYALAFDTADVPDVHRQGEHIEEFLETVMSMGKSPFDVYWILKQDRLNFKGKPDALCEIASWNASPYGCIAKTFQHREEIDKLEADNAEYLQRYRALLGYPAYQNVMSPRWDGVVPPWNKVFYGKRLFMSQLAERVTAGDVDGVLADLQMDYRFWANVSSPDYYSNILDRMLARNSLMTDYGFISEIIRTRPLTDKQRTAIWGILHSEVNTKLADVFAADFRGIENSIVEDSSLRVFFLGDLSGSRVVFVRYFLQSNATLNKIAPCYRRLTDLDHQTSVKVMQDIRSMQLDCGASDGFWRYIYNPAGHYLLRSLGSYTTYTQYDVRMIDLEGMRRLVSMQLAISEHKFTDAEIVEFLKSVTNLYSDPVTGGPMKWDAAKRELSFAADPALDKYMNTWLPLKL